MRCHFGYGRMSQVLNFVSYLLSYFAKLLFGSLVIPMITRIAVFFATNTSEPLSAENIIVSFQPTRGMLSKLLFLADYKYCSLGASMISPRIFGQRFKIQNELSHNVKA